MLFRHKSLTSSGEVKTGEIQAKSSEEAAILLGEQNLFPVQIFAGRKSFWSKLNEPRGSQHTASRKDVQMLLSDLGQLLASGVNLDKALLLAEDLTDKSHLKTVIREIRAELRGGSGFAQAFGVHSSTFQPHIISALSAAEKTGRLGEGLSRLAEAEKRMTKFTEKLTSSLLYPAILMAVVGITFVLVMFVVLPEFAPLFEVVGDDVPALTKIVLSLSESLQANVVPIGLIIAFLFAVATLVMASRDSRRALMETAFRSGRVRDWFLMPELIRASQILGTSLEVGVKADNAIMLAAESSQSEYLRNGLQEMARDVRRGKSLPDAARQIDFLPSLLVHFMQIGDETGKMGEMCLDASTHLNNRFQKKLDQLLSTLPPVITLILGGVVALLVGSVLLGMISLNRVAI